MGIHMYWEILDEQRQAVLRRLSEKILPDNCYMAGGTALSLQMKLRKSVDFDFFLENPFSEIASYEQIRDLGFSGLSALRIGGGTCDLRIGLIQVNFFYYPCQMLEAPVVDPESGLKLASLADIAAMKAMAIGGRGARKDFYDLYCILSDTGMTAEQLAHNLFRKYGADHDFSYVGMGMNYFDDAEGEILFGVYRTADWDEIKTFFRQFQKTFMTYL